MWGKHSCLPFASAGVVDGQTNGRQECLPHMHPSWSKSIVELHGLNFQKGPMMKLHLGSRSRQSFPLIVGSALLWAATAQAGLEDLLKRVPENSNGLIVVKVADLL